MSMHKMEMEKETSPITPGKQTTGEANSGVDYSMHGQDLEDEDEDTDAEIYNERRLLNGKIHKPAGNYLPKITNSRDQTKRGIKRPNGGSPNESPPKIFCVSVELNGILGVAIYPWHLQLDQEEEEDPGEDRDEPQQEVNKLLQDLNLPDRDL